MGLWISLYIGEETGAQSGRYDGKYRIPKPLMWAWPVLGDLYVSSHLILMTTCEMGLIILMLG